MKTLYFPAFLFTILLTTHAAFAETLPGIPEFIDEMVAKHHFKKNELQHVFEKYQYRQNVIDAISRPSTTKPWLEYRAAFVNPKRIKFGLQFWDKYRLTLRRAEKKYGIPQEIIIAIIGVETIYGRNTGSFLVLDSLTTLAFDYPRRAEFFRSELENFLLLAREQEFDLLAVRGSYAGAIGVPQFMPSSYRKYAIDFNNNKKIDLMHEDRDAIGSVANYLREYGWIKGAPIAVRAKIDLEACAGDTTTPRPISAWQADGIVADDPVNQSETARLMDFTIQDGKEFWLALNNFDVITRYNNSDFYAMSVFQLAEALKAAHHPKAK